MKITKVYTKTGDKITLVNYPFYGSGNKILTYRGSYLIDESLGEKFTEVK